MDDRRSHKPLVAGSNPAGSTILYILTVKELKIIFRELIVALATITITTKAPQHIKGNERET